MNIIINEKLTFKNVAIVLFPVNSFENQKRYFLLFELTLSQCCQNNRHEQAVPSHVPTQ